MSPNLGTEVSVIRGSNPARSVMVSIRVLGAYHQLAGKESPPNTRPRQCQLTHSASERTAPPDPAHLWVSKFFYTPNFGTPVNA
jgi:hypothetical protein